MRRKFLGLLMMGLFALTFAMPVTARQATEIASWDFDVYLNDKEVDLTLWYSPDNEWLGLESVAKGGHIIRYELS